MTKWLLRSGILVTGVVLAAVVAQHVVTDHSNAATESVNAATGGPQRRRDGRPTRPATQVAEAEPGDDAAGAAATATGPEFDPSEADNDETIEPKAEGTLLSRLLGWRGPQESEKETAREAVPPPVVIRSPIKSASAATAAAASTASECRKDDLQIQAQGVTADVSFVGILLAGSERQDQQFSGAELSDLRILVQWNNLFGHHLQRLDLVAPDGSVYQSLSRPLKITDAAAPVATVVPVSGSWITRYGLYGSWCVDVFFDHDEKPVASRRVVISS